MAKVNVGKILTSKGLGVGGMLSLGLNTATTISDYKDARLEGQGRVGSAISAAGNAIMFDVIGMPLMLTAGAIKHGPNMIVNGILKANAAARSMDRSSRNVAFNNATFIDSKQAYTMRQAGMQLAQSSKYNLQQTLMGNEASMMHRL